MDLNSFIRVVFQDKQTFHILDEKEKESYFFMFNRLMGRLKPYNSDAFNLKNINKYLATEAWFRYCKTYSYTPATMKINWAKYKNTKKNTYLKDYDSIDRTILSYYPELNDKLKHIDSLKEDDIKEIKIKKKKK